MYVYSIHVFHIYPGSRCHHLKNDGSFWMMVNPYLKRKCQSEPFTALNPTLKDCLVTAAHTMEGQVFACSRQMNAQRVHL